MPSTRDLQTALKMAGHDPGPIDGVYGRLTRAAVVALQATFKLPPTGIVGDDTLAALNIAAQGRLGAGTKPVLVGPIDPPWLAELLRRKGLHETRDKAALFAWLRSDKRSVGDPSKIPWCGDAVETPFALTLPNEPLPTNPYLARNWLDFGMPLAVPARGAVMVFWRGSRTGTEGHVSLYLRETTDAFCVLGGNQSDRICEAWIAKDRWLGARWPRTVPLPTGGRVIVANRSALSVNEA